MRQETPAGSFYCNLSRLLPDITNRVREEQAAPTAVCVSASLGRIKLIKTSMNSSKRQGEPAASLDVVAFGGWSWEMI